MMRNRLKSKWPHWPEGAIRPAQAEALRRYLRSLVLPFSAHYRTLFRESRLSAGSIRSLDDLRRIPFTSKADLLSDGQPEKFKDFVLVPDERILRRRLSTIARVMFQGRAAVRRAVESEFRPIFLTSTTGRSADPVAFLYTRHDLANLADTGRRLFEVCGGRPEYRMMNLFPYAPHLAFWQVHYGGTEFGTFVVSSGGGKTMGTEGNLRLIAKIQPEILIGMPTFIYHVLQQALEEGVRCPRLIRIVLGGEKVPAGIRRKLKDLAGQLGAGDVDVVATYGFTESKMAWAECPTPSGASPSGYHLYPDLGIVEVVDPDSGEPVPDGHAGEIVFTPLDARGSVVLRYRTGDLIEGGLTHEPCPHCGRNTPRLVGRISRRSEFKEMRLDKLKGTLVDFNQLEHVIDDLEEVGSWQLELRKRNDDPHEMDELILHVHVPGGGDRREITRRINADFASKTEMRPNRIFFHDSDMMRRLQGVGQVLKEKKIADNRVVDGERPLPRVTGEEVSPEPHGGGKRAEVVGRSGGAE